MPKFVVPVQSYEEGTAVTEQLEARGAEYDTDYTTLYGGRPDGWGMTGVQLITPKGIRLMADVVRLQGADDEPSEARYVEPALYD